MVVVKLQLGYGLNEFSTTTASPTLALEHFLQGPRCYTRLGMTLKFIVHRTKVAASLAWTLVFLIPHIRTMLDNNTAFCKSFNT
jgi:hypothetical protein